jgi:hypothetical protein
MKKGLEIIPSGVTMQAIRGSVSAWDFWSQAVTGDIAGLLEARQQAAVETIIANKGEK